MTFGLHMHRHSERAPYPSIFRQVLVTASWTLALLIALLYAGVRVLR